MKISGRTNEEKLANNHESPAFVVVVSNRLETRWFELPVKMNIRKSKKKTNKTKNNKTKNKNKLTLSVRGAR